MHFGRGVAAAALVAAALAWQACGYVGDPLPPALNYPPKVEGLAAIQRGDRIFARFQVPELTLDRLPLEIGDVELYAGPWKDSGGLDQWAAGARRIAVPEKRSGEHLVDFASTPWTGQEIVVAARVVHVNGRHGDWSDLAAVNVVPPLPPPGGVLAEAVKEGVAVRWDYAEQRPGLEFLVYRRQPETEWAFAGSSNSRQWIDTGTAYGQTYEYRVQARQVIRPAPAESELSGSVQVIPEDRFAPDPPFGLSAIAGLNAIELTWEPVPAPDLGAYRLYRARGETEWERIGEVASGVSFSDQTVERSVQYRYAVTALDRSGNESERSEPVEVRLPAGPPQ